MKINEILNAKNVIIFSSYWLIMCVVYLISLICPETKFADKMEKMKIGFILWIIAIVDLFALVYVLYMYY